MPFLYNGVNVVEGGNVIGGRDGVRNFPRFQIYSIVRKRHKGNPDQVNGDYSLR